MVSDGIKADIRVKQRMRKMQWVQQYQLQLLLLWRSDRSEGTRRMLNFAIDHCRTPALARLELAPDPALYARENPGSANKWPCNSQLRWTSIERGQPFQVFHSPFSTRSSVSRSAILSVTLGKGS
jgi:hypothetical protein